MEKLDIPLTEETLLQICSVDNQWIQYFLCRQAISDLLQSGFISKIKSGESAELFSLTQDGVLCVAHFYKDIPASKQNEIASYIRANRATYKKRQEFTADYSKNSAGTFTVTMKISQVSKILLSLQMEVYDEKSAQTMCDNWPKRAPDVYRSIVDGLSD